MNFLCHSEIALFISEQRASFTDLQPGMLAGAVLGDFIKGPIKETWDPDLALGIKLHRKIDAISNEDPMIKRACNRFPSRIRRIAPILIDIISDYFLANNWNMFQQTELETFSKKCHLALDRHKEYGDMRFVRFLGYMRQQSLLLNSGSWQSIERVTSSILKRLGKEKELKFTMDAMQSSKLELSEDFNLYYPRIRESSLAWTFENTPQ